MKKAISLTLAGSLLLTVLASCGGGSTPSDTTASGGETTPPAETQDPVLAALPEKDFNGAEIRVFSYGASASYNDSEYLYAEQTGEVIDDALYQRNIDTEQRLNCKIVYDDSHGENEAVKLFTNGVMAGDDFCDTFAIKAVDVGTILTSGTVLPWDDIPGLQQDKPWYVHDANEMITVGHKQYGVLTDALGTNMTMCWTFLFNKRMVDEWKLEDPYELVRAKKWTMDKVISLTKDIWVDVNGDNQHDAGDTYGFYTDKWATLDAMMVSHDIRSVVKDENDYPVVDFYSERTVKSFEKVYELYWENNGTYVDITNPYEYRIQFANGQGVFTPMLLTYLIGADLRSMADDYGVLPYPMLDEDQDDYHTHMLGRTGVFFLPVTLSDEKADMMGYFVDTLSAYSYKYLRPALYDVSLNVKGVRDDNSLEMLDIIMDSRRYDFSMYLEQSADYKLSPMRTFRNLIAAKNVNITSYYESNKETTQKYLDKIVETLQENEE